MKTTKTLRILTGLMAMIALVLCFAACDSSSEGSYYFQTKDGVKIAIGDTDEVVTSKLGAPISETSSASCGGFEGKDYVYTYKGFRVSTTPAKNGQIVCKVELTDDSVKTPEGLYIGMNRAWFYPKHLDEKVMQAAADQFVGTHDFAAVRSVGTDVKSTVRTVYYYNVERKGDIIELRVCANGFLYNMARAMAGTLVYAAEGVKLQVIFRDGTVAGIVYVAQ